MTGSAILLDEVREIKASLKALRGEINAQRLSRANSGARSFSTEETTAQPPTVYTSHTHEPKRSDAGCKTPGPPASPEMVSSRQVSLPASPRQLTSLPILEEASVTETTGELGQALVPGMPTTYVSGGSGEHGNPENTSRSSIDGSGDKILARAPIGPASSGGANNDATLIQEVRARGSLGAATPSGDEYQAHPQRSVTHMNPPREESVAAENGKSTIEIEGCNDSPDEVPVRADAEGGAGLVPIIDSLSERKQLPEGTATATTRFEETAGVGNDGSPLEGQGIAVEINDGARSR